MSVPVSWFNVNEWTRNFPRPNRTYIVAVVQLSHVETERHEMCILGSESDDNCFITHAYYLECRALWIEHGERVIPQYEFGKSTVEEVDMLGGTTKPLKKGEATLRVHIDLVYKYGCLFVVPLSFTNTPLCAHRYGEGFTLREVSGSQH